MALPERQVPGRAVAQGAAPLNARAEDWQPGGEATRLAVRGLLHADCAQGCDKIPNPLHKRFSVESNFATRVRPAYCRGVALETAQEYRIRGKVQDTGLW